VPDLPAQKAIAEKVQMRALETLPCIPLGQLFQPTAFRSAIRDIVKAAFPLFWGCGGGNGWVGVGGAGVCDAGEDLELVAADRRWRA
jgi:hypothetical protein